MREQFDNEQANLVQQLQRMKEESAKIKEESVRMKQSNKVSQRKITQFELCARSSPLTHICSLYRYFQL